MRKEKKQWLYKGIFILTAFFAVKMWWNCSESIAAAEYAVSNYSELKAALEQAGTAQIGLTKNITVSSTIYVQGKKTINGAGFTIGRKTGDGYLKGDLLGVGKPGEYAGQLYLQSVILNGKCRQSNMSTGVDGRLVKVHANSFLCLQNGSVLKQNYNSVKLVDGGGGIAVEGGGEALMQEGAIICDNKSMTGGGAIRIGSSGKMRIEGGTIHDNAVTAASSQDNFNGLGGGIHNSGDLTIVNCSLYSNIAEGLISNGIYDGGVGGGIYNAGTVTIYNGDYYGNVARNGGAGIYTTYSSKLFLYDGRINGNISWNMGGGIYVNNGAFFTMIGGSICNNNAQTGGGIYISKENSQVEIRDGVIENNVAQGTGTSPGGGVRNNGGHLIIKGGFIQNNSCTNSTIASYSTEIANEGIAEILGGHIGNGNTMATSVVNRYQATMYYYNGNGNLEGSGQCGINNQGDLIVGAFGDCYIDGYQYGIKNSGSLELYGGNVQGRLYGIYHISGSFRVMGKCYTQRIYLKKNGIITIGSPLVSECETLVVPEDYVDGRVIAVCSYDGGKGDTALAHFAIPENSNYLYLRGADNQVQIQRGYYKVHYNAQGGVGTMTEDKVYLDTPIRIKKTTFTREGFDFVGWCKKPGGPIGFGTGDTLDNKTADLFSTLELYAYWTSVPQLDLTKAITSYYEGEYVDLEVLRYGVKSVDAVYGDLSKEVVIESITYENSGKASWPKVLDTCQEHIGNATITYYSRNQNAVSGRKKLIVQIKYNEPPKIITGERYFLLSDVQSLYLSQKKKIIGEGLVLQDDIETKSELLENFSADLSKVRWNQEGEYEGEVTIRDQYGHRPYMNKDEKKQYGIGKETKAKLRISLVKGENEGEFVYQGKTRFIDRPYIDTLQEQSYWKKGGKEMLNKVLEYHSPVYEKSFNKEEIYDMKQWLRNHHNDFSSEENQEFYDRYLK